MSDIKIVWLDDSHNCETCGWSDAYGARVTIDGVVALEYIPVAHCYNGRSWDPDDVYEMVIRHLGHTIDSGRPERSEEAA